MRDASSSGKQYHIACAKGDLAEYLLVPGDPDRVPKIARFWDTARNISVNREFRSCTGTYKGVAISALSSGIVHPAFPLLLTKHPPSACTLSSESAAQAPYSLE